MLEVFKKFTEKPNHIHTKQDMFSTVGIQQFYINVDAAHDAQLEVLFVLCREVAIVQTIILVNTRERVRSFPVSDSFHENHIRTRPQARVGGWPWHRYLYWGRPYQV